MINKVIIPDVGASSDCVEILRWLVKEGEFVRAREPLLEIESDKASMQIESFCDGWLRRILVAPGETVRLGAGVAILTDTPGERFEGVEPASDVSKVSTAALAATTDGDQGFIDLFRQMVVIRRFEDHLYRLFLQGLVPGTLHQCQGQEAVAVGVCCELRNDDLIFSTHRPVGHMLAKGASIKALAAEIWGKATGCAGGKGGQMHLSDISVGAMPSNAIVGGNVPIATGAALGFKLRGLDRVAVSFFGDGAINIGALHEGINLAAVKRAPVLFVCENNLYAASTPIHLTCKIEDIADRARGYGIPGIVVDGMDVLAVREAAREAIERARRGDGPSIIEAKTYRFCGHSRGDPMGYRSKEEVQQWRDRDPILRLRRLLIDEEALSEAHLERIEKECQAEVEGAVQFAVSSPDPAPETCYEKVYAERENHLR